MNYLSHIFGGGGLLWLNWQSPDSTNNQSVAAAGVLKGRGCNCYPAVGPDVTCAGGVFVEVPIDQAHVDGNLVTAPAWPAHPVWLAKLLVVLGTRIEP